MNILIAGDSFSAKWASGNGWVDMLAKNHNVTNIAQAGCGEYKIYKQIVDQNLNNFDCVIVSHTSPSRVHTRNHPLHKEGFHKDCDLIFTDLEGRCSFFNKNLEIAKGWFEYHYDDSYQTDVYKLLREKINNIITIPYISLSHIPIVNKLAVEQNHIDFSGLWLVERGNCNHYTKEGNETVYAVISKELDNLTRKSLI